MADYDLEEGDSVCYEHSKFSYEIEITDEGEVVFTVWDHETKKYIFEKTFDEVKENFE